jgi:hypothetical protein
MVVTKCWAAREDAHTRPHTQKHTHTHTHTHTQITKLKQRGRLEWLGGWRKARLHPSSHSSQNRLLIFRRNGSASELVNGDATITLDIRQFRSKMMNGKPKNRITSKNWPILAKFVFFIFHRIELVHGMLQLHSTSDSSGL